MTDYIGGMNKHPNEYLNNAVMTASPEQLQLMLYDGAIRFARQGIEGLNAKDYEKTYNGFSRAQKIVLELINALNYDIDRDMCSRMAGLYSFIYRKLVEASAQRDASIAGEAVKLLEYQRETWVMLLDKLREERAAAEPAGNAARGAWASDQEDTVDTCYGTLSVQG
ncbi:MAG: flagellar export chaperone FliS [Phycisphaerales bacterium]|nr:flagellar export chaperone FliS [Phycisphaerales bacterium]